MSAETIPSDDRWAGCRRIIEDMKRVGAVPDSERPDGIVQAPEFSGHKGIYLANLEGCLGGSFPTLLAERDRLHEAIESVIVRMDDGSVRLREWDRSPTELAVALAAALDAERS